MNGIRREGSRLYMSKKEESPSALRSSSKKSLDHHLSKSTTFGNRQNEKSSQLSNGNVFSKLGGNIINSQNILLNSKINIKPSNPNEKNNFMNLFLGNGPTTDISVNKRSKSNGKVFNFNYNQSKSKENIDLSNPKNINMITNIILENTNVANGGNVLTASNDLLKIHMSLWESLFNLELNCENKAILNVVSKSYYNEISENLNIKELSFELFEINQLNKTYQKLIKLSLVLNVYLRFVLTDFNFETTIKTQVKKLFSTFNNELIFLIENYIMPFSNVIKETKEVMDKYSVLLKLHKLPKTKTKEPTGKSLDSIISSIKLFSNNFFKMGFFKPIHMACFDLIKFSENTPIREFNTLITNHVLLSMMNSEKEKKITQSLSNKQIIFNSPTFSNNFIVNYNIPSPFLPPASSETFTLVLDLDETLIHFFYTPSGGCFLVRPFAFEFLRILSQIYEIVIFTAAMKDYADNILDILDKDKNYIKYRLYRQHTSFSGPCVVKDLSKIGRDLSKTIIVDNIPENFKLQQNNGFFIKTWNEDLNDQQLRDLCSILQGKQI